MKVYKKIFVIYVNDNHLSVEWIKQQDKVTLKEFFEKYHVEIVELEEDETIYKI
jgi:hypothetical protein